MNHLFPCPGCERHVRAADAVCPFCAEPLPLSLRRSSVPLAPSRRLGRAATFAFGAVIATASGCGESHTAEDAGGDAGMAEDAMVLDAGLDAAMVIDAGFDSGTMMSAYGAPPDAGSPPDAAPVEDAGVEPEPDGGIFPPYGAPPPDEPPPPPDEP